MQNIIPLEETNPFVRYVHVFGVHSPLSKQRIVPLDNRCFFVREGELGLDIGAETVRLTPHQLVLIRAGCPYKFLSLSSDAAVLGINFDFTRNASKKKIPIVSILLEDYSAENLAEGECRIEQLGSFEFLHLQNAGRFSEITESIELEFKSGRVLSDASLSSKMKQFLVEIAEWRSADGASARTVKETLAFIRAHCTERLSNAEIGQALSFHPNYLNRLIRAYTGKSLHAYLNHCRVLHAIGLLQTTALSIEEVALTSGFGDLQQFSKAFRKTTGQTPSKFRQIV